MAKIDSLFKLMKQQGASANFPNLFQRKLRVLEVIKNTKEHNQIKGSELFLIQVINIAEVSCCIGLLGFSYDVDASY